MFLTGVSDKRPVPVPVAQLCQSRLVKVKQVFSNTNLTLTRSLYLKGRENEVWVN